MGGPLNVHPRGLLSFFDLKSPSYPKVLGEAVSPVIDLLRWYVDSGTIPLEIIGGNVGAALNATAGAAANNAGLATLSPANTEVWYVRRAYLELTFTAAAASTVMGGRPIVLQTGPAVPQKVSLRCSSENNFPFSNNAAAICRAKVTVDEDFLLLGGQTLSYEHDGFIFGAATMQPELTAQFLRLRA